MDLGIRGKKAIVCASSRGLGKGCAMALAEAGCDLVVNGRDAEVLARTAAEIRERFGVDCRSRSPATSPIRRSRRSCSPPVPRLDILVNNNGGPPFRAFQRTRPRVDPERRHQQHGRAAGTHPGGDRRHGRTRFRPHRQHHVAVGLCADSRPRPLLGRARRPDVLPGRRGARRSPTRTSPSTTCCPASSTPTGCAGRTSPARSEDPAAARRARRAPRRRSSRQAPRHAGGVRPDLRLPLLGPCRLPDRPEHPGRRRALCQRILTGQLTRISQADRSKHL